MTTYLTSAAVAHSLITTLATLVIVAFGPTKNEPGPEMSAIKGVAKTGYS